MRIVKYELKGLERLMSSNLHAHLSDRTANSVQHELSFDNLRVEIARIRNAFLQEGFVFKDELHLRRYVHFHQQAIIEMMDDAFLEDDALKEDHTNTEYCAALEELLFFIEKNFNEYFDLDAKAPLSFIHAARINAGAFMRTTNEHLTSNHSDPAIVNIIFHAMRKLNDTNLSSHVSFRMIRFARTLQDQVSRVMIATPKNINEDLLQVIYFVNYNTIQSFLYHTRLVDSILNKDQTRGEQIEQLSILLKKVNQAPVCSGIMYNPKVSSLKSQLADYILEEIAHIERISVSTTAVTSNTNPDLSFRLALELSVSQLAFMIRIFSEMKIIKNKNISEVIRFLVRFVVTSKAENLSFDSMRTKFYTVETVTRDSLRKVLSGMIRYIDQDDS